MHSKEIVTVLCTYLVVLLAVLLILCLFCVLIFSLSFYGVENKNIIHHQLKASFMKPESLTVKAEPSDDIKKRVILCCLLTVDFTTSIPLRL